MEDPEELVKHRMAPRASATITPPGYTLDSEKAEDPKIADVEMNSVSGGKEVEERDFHRKQVSHFTMIDHRQSSADSSLNYRSFQGGSWHGM